MSTKENLALIGEVTKERAFGESRVLSYLGGRRLIESPLAKERERGILKTSLAIWLPTSHLAIILSTAVTDISAILTSVTDMGHSDEEVYSCTIS